MHTNVYLPHLVRSNSFDARENVNDFLKMIKLSKRDSIVENGRNNSAVSDKQRFRHFDSEVSQLYTVQMWFCKMLITNSL